MTGDTERDSAGAPARFPLRVLILEESEEDASPLLRELERGGYEPTYRRVASPEAMRDALAEGGEWELVLCEWRMARFSAGEALEVLGESRSQAPFIVVSGEAAEEGAVEALRAGAADYVTRDNLTRLCPAVERSLKEAEGRRERKRAEEELRRREAIPRAVAFSAEHFLKETASSWEESVQEVLEQLGQAAEVSRVYIFENYLGEDGATWTTQRYEWVVPGVAAQIGNPALNALPYRAAGLGRWEDTLGRGEVLHGHVREYPESEQPGRRAQGILSQALVPIFVEGEWWGFIGFDECEREREFSAAEIDALKAAAGTLGAAIGRTRVERALRESEQRFRATFEQSAEGVLLFDTATGEILESNAALQELLGYTAGELLDMRIYDLIAHDKESIDSNIRLVLEGSSRFVGERRYQRKNGSLVDVEVSANLISYGGREVICTVIRDITGRVESRRILEERVGALAGIAASLTVDQPVETTLNALADSVFHNTEAVASTVSFIDERTDEFRIVGSRGLPEGWAEAVEAAWQVGAPANVLQAFQDHEPRLLPDACRFFLEDPLSAPMHLLVREVSWEAVFILPLVYRGRALGGIATFYEPEQEPGEDEMAFLEAVADQAAVAVENARLYSEAQDKAVLEERQRLARELHDSVSQDLYGISLGAKTARTFLDKDPSRVAEPLDYVLSLSEAGLSEMRALIFELRPESLEKEGLVDALDRQGAAVEARHGIKVRPALSEEPDISINAKEVLYRIAQEALHNAVKHARASKVELRLLLQGGGAEAAVTLEVCDDGVGFDPEQTFPGHLGLESMRERAASLGGEMEVESAPGDGTRMRARIPS